jgi:hypothetical protein
LYFTSSELRTPQTLDTNLHSTMTANSVAMRHPQPVDSPY